ncbi:MAG: hypothetical protein WBW94_08210 [Anaerolineales bacterium]
MTSSSPLTSVDQDAERRRILAKVYALLISLADEEEKQSTLSINLSQEMIEKRIVSPAKPRRRKVESKNKQSIQHTSTQ